MITGFNAYCCYLFTKNIHFKDNNYNIMSLSDIPMKDKLLNSWNDKRRKQDGLKFLEIEKKCSDIKQLALLYASYYTDNSNFYIQDIFEDDFEKYRNNIIILKNLKEVLTNDLNHVIMFIKSAGISHKDLLTSKTSIPKIFKMRYSINTIVILNDLFHIIELNKNLKINSLEMEAWKNVQLNIRWYKPIIKSYLDKHNWKSIAKEILKK